jgi:hypothetical protein
MSENRDLALPVLTNVVNEWLIAQQMNFRRLVYRPSWFPDDVSWRELPDDPHVADILRFAMGMERPTRRWMIITEEELMAPPQILPPGF